MFPAPPGSLGGTHISRSTGGGGQETPGFHHHRQDEKEKQLSRDRKDDRDVIGIKTVQVSLQIIKYNFP